MTSTQPTETSESIIARGLWVVALAIAVVMIATAFVPLVPVDLWWVRIGDFPRVQLLLSYLIGIVAMAVFRKRRFALICAGLLSASVLIQLYWIYPYLPGSPLQVEWAESSKEESRLRILTANVLQENDNATSLLRLIEAQSPDVVVLCEVNDRWIEQLEPLNETFDFQVLHPMENKYGIAIYSKLRITSSNVRAMVKETIPSIDAMIRLRSGHPVRLFAVHPNPPRPGEDTTKRDAELVLVGREVQGEQSTIVLGDMNDVGWSRTTDLFQEVSGLLDPREGRGLYPTFNAHSFIWRYPLDHLFHSDDFRVAEIFTLPAIGSDHLPLLVELSHEPDAIVSQEGPDLDAGDREDANEAVEALSEPGALAEPG